VQIDSKNLILSAIQFDKKIIHASHDDHAKKYAFYIVHIILFSKIFLNIVLINI
jgi:hypothetical protein